MSVDAGLTITLSFENQLGAALESLLRSGWRPDSAGWWLLPSGADSFEWDFAPAGDALDLSKLMLEKHGADEVFGLRLWWDRSEVGGEFLFYRDGQIIFSPSINRVKFGPRTSDVNWYVRRIIPIFQQSEECSIDCWSWSETS